MKKFLLFVGSALLAMSVSAQKTLTLAENSWEQDGETMTNSQGMIALEPSMTIEKGYKVTVYFDATVTGEDVALSAILVDTATRYDEFGENPTNWSVESSWESASVTSGAVVKQFTFTAANAIAGPVLVLSTSAGTTYNETFTFSKLECTVSDPNYRDPNVTIDETTITLLELNCNWGSSTYNPADSTITFEKAWTGQGWAWWGTGLDVTDYKSITVEFEETDCMVQLWAQQLPDGVTPDDALVSGSVVAQAGETSLTLRFYDDIFTPFEKQLIGQICLQTENAGTLKLKSVYLTYESDDETAVSEVAQDVQIASGIVYSKGQITVYNVAGNVVASAAKQFDMNTLGSGIYLIKTAEGVVKYMK